MGIVTTTLKKLVLQVPVLTLLLLASLYAQAEGPCDEAEQAFKARYQVDIVSESQAMLRKLSDGNSNFVIAIGEEFQDMRHKHGRDTYRLKSIKRNRIEFSLHRIFEGQSFGGNQEQCITTIIVEAESN